jgi:RNA polymerase sigma factor (sigma-70 family)
LFECLVGRRLPALTRILCASAARLGLDESVALEALQEALTEAVRRIRSGHAATQPHRWPLLLGYARWRLLDTVRGFLPTTSIDPAARTWLPPDPLEQQELRAALAEAFHELPPRLRAVAAYCYQQQHTYQEAADHFGRSPGTINRWLHQAREHLRASLLRRGIGAEFV